MYPGNANSRILASSFRGGRSAGGSGRSCNGALQTSVGGYDYGASGQCLCFFFFCMTICLKVLKTKVLTCLALMYISPTTMDNQELRQCLSYFFPVYSYSSPANQDRMQSVSLASSCNEIEYMNSCSKKRSSFRLSILRSACTKTWTMTRR